CAPGRGHVRPRERGHHVRLDRRVSPTRGSDGRLRWRPVTYLARRLSGDVHERRPGLPDPGGPRAPHRPGIAPAPDSGGGGGVRVVAQSGRRVERGPARATGRSVSVDVDAAEQGTYVVSWRVVSGDAQPERGRFTFTVGRPTATVAALPDDMRTASRSGFVL